VKEQWDCSINVSLLQFRCMSNKGWDKDNVVKVTFRMIILFFFINNLKRTADNNVQVFLPVAIMLISTLFIKNNIIRSTCFCVWRRQLFSCNDQLPTLYVDFRYNGYDQLNRSIIQRSLLACWYFKYWRPIDFHWSN
jgi:hypothetical protein